MATPDAVTMRGARSWRETPRRTVVWRKGGALGCQPRGCGFKSRYDRVTDVARVTGVQPSVADVVGGRSHTPPVVVFNGHSARRP